MLEFPELLLPNAGWAHLMVCPEKDVDRFVSWRVHTGKVPPGTVVRIVRASHDRCCIPDRLFQEWAAALQFPWYFGHNWDAWDECLADLEWLPGRGYVFFVTQVARVLPDQDRDFRVFVHLLDKVSEEWATPIPPEQEWSRPAVPFRIVFHCEPEHETEVRKRLEQAGAVLPKQ